MPEHILIIGGGIVGLTLAQALRKQHPGVRCTVYERDASPTSRGAGWGLTIHWALPAFLELLPADISGRLEETFVDPEATKAGDGNFLLYDLRSGQDRFRVPPSKRIRVRREGLRRLLMEGVSIEVSQLSLGKLQGFVFVWSLFLFQFCIMVMLHNHSVPGMAILFTTLHCSRSDLLSVLYPTTMQGAGRHLRAAHPTSFNFAQSMAATLLLRRI
jgi:hypothetical protein